MVTKYQFDQGSISITGERYTDNQRIGINIRYAFGIKPKEERHDMMQHEEEE
jgi:hypothetical protein